MSAQAPLPLRQEKKRKTVLADDFPTLEYESIRNRVLGVLCEDVLRICATIKDVRAGFLKAIELESLQKISSKMLDQGKDLLVTMKFFGEEDDIYKRIKKAHEDTNELCELTTKLTQRSEKTKFQVLLDRYEDLLNHLITTTRNNYFYVCPICSNQAKIHMNFITLACGHLLCQTCFVSLIRNPNWSDAGSVLNCSCPLCRYPIYSLNGSETSKPFLNTGTYHLAAIATPSGDYETETDIDE